PAPRFPQTRERRRQLPIPAIARNGATSARRRPEPGFHHLYERMEGLCGGRGGVRHARRFARAAIAALAMLQAAAPRAARAEDCRPDTLARFDIGTRAVLIPVTIDTQGYIFMVDTGGSFSTLSPGVAG